MLGRETPTQRGDGRLGEGEEGLKVFDRARNGASRVPHTRKFARTINTLLRNIYEARYATNNADTRGRALAFIAGGLQFPVLHLN